jgi:hypothetical protein
MSMHTISEDQGKSPSGADDSMILEPDNWESTFGAGPHSNQALRELPPTAIQETIASKTEWSHPSDFHKAVSEWWAGQKCILFHTHIIAGLSEILPALTQRHHLEKPPSLQKREQQTLKNVLQRPPR